jgi:hypothetical protein
MPGSPLVNWRRWRDSSSSSAPRRNRIPTGGGCSKLPPRRRASPERRPPSGRSPLRDLNEKKSDLGMLPVDVRSDMSASCEKTKRGSSREIWTGKPKEKILA